MTHRERHSSDEAPSVGDASLWADWYQRASPAQRQEALLRAVQAGILYAHQLAPPAHSIAVPRSLLSSLLNGQVKDLEPLCPPPLECHDKDLDAWQRDAVARAVATPDVCLIQGFPGTGKSRLAAEILRQASQRGERVLFLAPTAAALDRVLERISCPSTMCALRCLGEEENPAALPPAVARLTLAERLRFYRETTLPAARSSLDAARRTLDALSGQQTQWAQLEKAAEQHDQLAEQVQRLNARRAGIAEEVEREEPSNGPLREQWQNCQRAWKEALERLDGQLAGLRAERETIADKQSHLENEWEGVRPLAEARRGGRFWTGTWWRAVLRGGLSEQVRQLETRRAELQTAMQRLEQHIAARQSERAALEKQHADECRRLRDEEIAGRQTVLDAEIADWVQQRDALRQQAGPLLSLLGPEVSPSELSGPAVAAGRAAWERRRLLAEHQVAAAEQWLQTVEDGLRTLPQQLAGCANVVAATTAALPRDVHFGDREGTPAVLFDLLILEEAHQVTEAEFASAARRARRWVLIGEPRLDDLAIPSRSEPAPQRKAVRSAASRPGFFDRLWQSLHTDPRRLPFLWLQRDGRLLCRLRSLSADQEKHLEIEPVVDRPDIELHILSLPKQTPQIVEVLFPAGMALAEAKQFLFHEMEELAVQTRGRAMHWVETDEEVALEMASTESETVAVRLEAGVCERVARLPASACPVDGDGLDWHTCALAFARADGWTRPRAEQWITERLGQRCTGRTILLTRPHRLDPPLARILSDLMFGGLCHPVAPLTQPSPPPGGEGRVRGWPRPPLEFVAVPSLASLESRHRSESTVRSRERASSGVSLRSPRPRTIKGGAGLEQDLAQAQALEHVPADLRALLPRQGLINYLEAQALVKRLEALITEEAFVSACEQWRQRRSGPSEHNCSSPSACSCASVDNGPAVAVIALYSAQVELLRQLIRQTPALSSAPVAIEVGPPAAFQHRECLLALVSLTRSHTHRAVPYSEHPHALALALTRAASGLILFGDPGTLTRRSQWNGPLDHLDDGAARHEGSLIGQLVQYLQGRGAHPALFYVQEGRGV